MISNIPFDRVNWVNSIFLLSIALTALIGAPLYLIFFGIDWFQIALFCFYGVATGMSITLGYHRLFSHLSFKAKWPVRLFTLVFGACAFENSALKWCCDHRRHHKHTDHEGDPYDISNGFLWAHIGWILFKIDPEPPYDNVPDLKKDRLVMWQHRWDKLIAITVGLLLPTALGFLWSGWQGALGAFLIAGVLRIFIVQQSTFFINSLCHTIGKQPYSSKCSARDSFIMSLFTFGEGYHNYHHRFQHDYRNGVKPWNFDPTKWAIWALEKAGLASNLKRVSPSKILLAEMTAARHSAEEELLRVSKSENAEWREKATTALNALIERIQVISEELEEALKHRAEVSRSWMLRRSARIKSVLDDIATIRSLRLPVPLPV